MSDIWRRHLPSPDQQSGETVWKTIYAQLCPYVAKHQIQLDQFVKPRTYVYTRKSIPQTWRQRSFLYRVHTRWVLLFWTCRRRHRLMCQHHSSPTHFEGAFSDSAPRSKCSQSDSGNARAGYYCYYDKSVRVTPALLSIQYAFVNHQPKLVTQAARLWTRHAWRSCHKL